ncbi:hypothetical protein [Evansella tamaricis]|uniref:Uncharacterized protein n=1 Tax=Evansella tamaricis TaxID=2069301 RepID=A0ABS6J9F0_9BACI|nr:hypothetical protein [Evansella tamaricis]MBU9710312.1 hypothetical protein [Evansella tamaricis]
MNQDKIIKTGSLLFGIGFSIYSIFNPSFLYIAFAITFIFYADLGENSSNLYRLVVKIAYLFLIAIIGYRFITWIITTFL